MKNNSKIIPAESIVPILGRNDAEEYGPFLGTGAFVGKSPLLVTAEHVIRGWKRNFGICVNTGSLEFNPAEIVHKNKEVDLAL